MENQYVDRMFRILFNSVPPEVIDSLNDDDVAGLITGVWNTFNPSDQIEYEDVLKRTIQIKQYRQELQRLRRIPYIAQRTDEWYKLRRERLTASDTAQALGKGKFGTRDQLIRKKAQEILGKSQPFKMVQAMKWGVMFEAMAMRCYQTVNDNVSVYEFGMIPHPTLKCYGASPDGITELGIMTEIKCPFKRKITGEVPDYYELQMQGQMAVCNLKECDYIECDMQVFDTFDDYNLMVDGARTQHGVICEFTRNTETYYEYSDPQLTAAEANAWAREFAAREMRRDPTIQLVKLHYWKLRNMFVKRVYFDESRWELLAPQIESFWNDVKTATTTSMIPCCEDSSEVIAEKAKYTFIPDDDD